MKKYTTARKKIIQLSQRLARRVSWKLLALCAVLLLGYIAYQVTHQKPTTNSATNPSATAQSSPKNGELVKATPQFKTLLPTGRSIEDFGGWTRVSPPDRDPVFAYADMFENSRLIVSQQQLPKELQNNTRDLDMLADGYHADHFITVDGTKAHIGTSAKGPQSVIFTRSNLLILIKSSTKLSDDAWIRYIHSLR